jgi:hypothetical protein
MSVDVALALSVPVVFITIYYILKCAILIHDHRQRNTDTLRAEAEADYENGINF